MATLRVSGVPKNLKIMKFVFMLKKALSDLSQRFYVQPKLITGNHLKTGLKDVLVEFECIQDAQVAQERMDNFAFTYNNDTYVFNASFTKTLDSYYARKKDTKTVKRKRNGPQHEYQHENYEDKYSDKPFSPKNRYKYENREYRGRSPSPLTKRSSALNMEIELLQKQRMIIEEERKLLLEQKKLDELKMLNTRKDVKIERSSPSFTQKRKPDAELKKAPPPKKYKQPVPVQETSTQLPSFYKPCGVLISGMSAHLAKHAPNLEHRKLVIRLLRSKLRERIALALDGHRVFKTGKIVFHYRKNHPVSTDEDLIKDLVKTIKDTCWPGGDIPLNKKGLPKKINPRVYSEATSSASQSAPEEEATEDTTATGENNSTTSVKVQNERITKNDQKLEVIEIEDSDTADLEVIEPTRDENVEDKKEPENSDQTNLVEDSDSAAVDISKKVTGDEIASNAKIEIIEPKQDTDVEVKVKENEKPEKSDQTNVVGNSSNAELKIIEIKQDDNVEDKVKEKTKHLEKGDQTNANENNTVTDVSNNGGENNSSSKTDDLQNTKESAAMNAEELNISASELYDDLVEWPEGEENCTN